MLVGHLLPGLCRLFFGLGDFLLGLGHGDVAISSIFSRRFEDLVGQHAVGHFVRGDLVAQRLIFAIAVGLIELGFQIRIFAFAASSAAAAFDRR